MKRFFRCILLIVNLLFVVLMLLSTLAGYVRPSRLVWVSIISYGYFVLLLANIAFVVVWLCLSRWEFLISVAAIAVRYTFLPLFFQVGGTLVADASESTLKVMTFNTHSFTGADSKSTMTQDDGATAFLKIVDGESPDVMCLQECYPSGKINLIDSLEKRGYVYHHGVSSKKSPLVLYSRCPITHVSTIGKKSKFYADITKNGRQVRVCCVHLDSYHLEEDDLIRLEQLGRAQYDEVFVDNFLSKFKETVLHHEREWDEDLSPLIEATETPLILAGDFNDTPASYIYQRATRVLGDPYTEQGRGFGTTYHGPYPAFRIDYILHSKDIVPLSYKRVKTDISDHYPVVVLFDLDAKSGEE